MEQTEFSRFDDQNLESFITQLKSLCDNMDPFAPIEEEERERLHDLGLTQLEDPYQLTNLMLKNMEDALEEWERRHNKPYQFCQ